MSDGIMRYVIIYDDEDKKHEFRYTDLNADMADVTKWFGKHSFGICGPAQVAELIEKQFK